MTAREAHFARLSERLSTRERAEKFDRIFSTNHWGDPESRSGAGSTLSYTHNVRLLLATAFERFNIRDWIDAPCGDCNWQPTIANFDRTTYLGVDIVPAIIAADSLKYKDRANMRFQPLDFINSPFPHTPDLILCRDAIQHNTLHDGVSAYLNMERSGAKYLATTWHNNPISAAESPNAYNRNAEAGGMYQVNVMLHPFNFSRPLFFIREGPNGTDPEGKVVGVWKLPALGLGDGLPWVMSPEDTATACNSIVDVARPGQAAALGRGSPTDTGSVTTRRTRRTLTVTAH